MVKRWGPPSQGWRSFLRNHAPDIAAMDLFVVPTIGFSLPCVTENLIRRRFRFSQAKSLFLRQNSLFLRNNSLFCCVGNFAASL